MALQPLRGFRDFYPEDQFKINYLRSKITAVCNLFGYEEFEGPVLESFDLYAAKSSDEIVNEQAFLIKSRGDDDKQMVLRPELTPTLARMIATKQNELVFPLRWWSFGRFWRYERPQKGRGREFYQWNCDLLGNDSAQADAEILIIIVQFLQSLGLTQNDIVIELNDRSFINQYLTKQGFTNEKTTTVFKYLDRLAKLNSEEQKELARKLSITPNEQEIVDALFQQDYFQSQRLSDVMTILEQQGYIKWFSVNFGVVRGFTYYTGLVFEVSDREKQFRALIGGGRYENLIAALGGQPLSGIGFGMGDMVLLEFLEQQQLLPEYKPNIRAIVISLDQDIWGQTILEELRNNKVNCLFYNAGTNPAKGLKLADQKQIPLAIIIGPDECNDQTITVKNLKTGSQETLPFTDALPYIKSFD